VVHKGLSTHAAKACCTVS